MGLLTHIEEIARGTLRDPLQHIRKRERRECSICDFSGFFLSAGKRQEARCPHCASKERDRIIGLHLKREKLDAKGKAILHFSAERPFFHQWKRLPGYVAGDIKKSKVANAFVDITAIKFPQGHFDLLICNHVLEHVPDDRKAMAECFRVMKPGGVALFSVPLSGQPMTWEPPADMPVKEVEKVCGWDHKRLYGDDFAERLASVGFKVDVVEVTPEDERRYRLSAGEVERVYACRKPLAVSVAA